MTVISLSMVTVSCLIALRFPNAALAAVYTQTVTLPTKIRNSRLIPRIPFGRRCGNRSRAAGSSYGCFAIRKTPHVAATGLGLVA